MRLSVSQVTHNTTKSYGLISRKRFGHLFLGFLSETDLVLGHFPSNQMPVSTGTEGDPVDMPRVQTSSVWDFQEESGFRDGSSWHRNLLCESTNRDRAGAGSNAGA
jgi:hypothetical protein